jgi:CheY-like chemotaxis protein
MSKPQILMIEDNPLEIDLLRISLNRLGGEYELKALRDGAEAIQFVRTRHADVRETEPRLILLNLHLPKYDGLEVLEAVKRDPVFRRIEVITLSSGTIPLRAKAEIQHKGALFREKPRNLMECLELAADVLDLCHRPSAVSQDLEYL